MSTDPIPADSVPAAAPEAAPAPVVVAGAEEQRIGRFTRAELEAMRGKRGRKPAEYHQLFPASGDADSAPVAARAPKVAGTRQKRAPKLPAVSSAVIGDHTIDDLLALIGSTGRKPVAYDILRQAAQVFADLGALELPAAPVVEVDPLVAQVAAASPQMRETIEALLALAPRTPRKYKPRAAKVAAVEAVAVEVAAPVV